MPARIVEVEGRRVGEARAEAELVNRAKAGEHRADVVKAAAYLVVARSVSYIYPCIRGCWQKNEIPARTLANHRSKGEWQGPIVVPEDHTPQGTEEVELLKPTVFVSGFLFAVASPALGK